MGVQEKIATQIGSDAVVLYMKGQPQAAREGIKVFSSWPTIPQLYIQGEFIGGNGIVRELYEQGELQKLLQSAKAG
ncbi:glutaredoxin domain-containing protein [Marinobacter sp.]|uniref:glutaredoxin domain-containing protein n=1 Tax=Marinobacter sp. TaxID=50741 RepID=UPI0035638DF6